MRLIGGQSLDLDAAIAFAAGRSWLWLGWN